MRWAILALAVVVCAPGYPDHQAAGQSLRTYRGRQRRVAWFNFEERPRNPNELPEHWFTIGREALTSNPNFARYPLHRQLTSRSGFPRYTQVGFDTQYAVSPKHSFRLKLNSGSAGAFLEVGAVGVVENSDYRVTAQLRTTNLQLAMAQLTAYFIDRNGEKIAASESASQPMQTDGKWKMVSVKLMGNYPDAAWIGLQLELNQPQYNRDDLLGSHQVVLKEVDGTAWFDDIAVYQLPRLVVGTQSRVNIIRAPHKPKLSVQVLDLTGRPLRAELVIYDHRMQQVTHMQRAVGSGAPPTWQWMPPLERYGWYLIDMQVYEVSLGPPRPGLLVQQQAKQPIARTVHAFLWLPEEQLMHATDATRFGLVLEDLSNYQLDLLPEVMEKAELDAVVISAWQRRLTLEQLDKYQSRLDDIIQRLLTRRREITFSLYPLPNELATALDISANSPMEMFAKPIGQWRPFLAPVLMRHAQRVRRWQVGPTDNVEAFYDAHLGQAVASIAATLSNMAPQPQIVLPWHINQSRRMDVGVKTAYVITTPMSALAHYLNDYMEPWKQSPVSDFKLTLTTPPADQMIHRRRINDLVLRMLYAWEGGAGGLQIPKPWTLSSDRNHALLPDPVLGAFTTVAHRLAGRSVVGRLPLGHGSQCMILDGPAGGMLAVWNKSSADDDAVINMFLGKNPVAIDIWGNRTPVSQRQGKHFFKLSRTPVFIEGINPQLALFRASFRLNQPFIESKQVQHQRTLLLSNPWPRTISGHMLILEPGEWTMQPRRQFFSIAAGRSVALPVNIRFPISEVAGRKQLAARFDFLALRKYQVELATPMELWIKDIEFEANLSLEKNSQTAVLDAVVTVLITNKGAKPISLRALATLNGHPRQIFPVPSLRPGQSVVRQFRFPDAAEQIKSNHIRVRLRELAGPAVLNHILRADGG